MNRQKGWSGFRETVTKQVINRGRDSFVGLGIVYDEIFMDYSLLTYVLVYLRIRRPDPSTRRGVSGSTDLERILVPVVVFRRETLYTISELERWRYVRSLNPWKGLLLWSRFSTEDSRWEPSWLQEKCFWRSRNFSMWHIEVTCYSSTLTKPASTIFSHGNYVINPSNWTDGLNILLYNFGTHDTPKGSWFQTGIQR